MEVCSVDRAVLESALNSGFDDFEDAVQIFGAVAQNLDVIVTRDRQESSWGMRRFFSRLVKIALPPYRSS